MPKWFKKKVLPKHASSPPIISVSGLRECNDHGILCYIHTAERNKVAAETSIPKENLIAIKDGFTLKIGRSLQIKGKSIADNPFIIQFINFPHL